MYAKQYGVDLAELRLALEEHPSLAAFFVRRLREGARTFCAEPGSLAAPCDGTVQAVDQIQDGMVLQAKGRPYAVKEILGETLTPASLEGGSAWTIYLSPRDYHRVHAPVAGQLEQVRWLGGARFSVAPKVLLARPKVLSVNERAVLRLASEHGPLYLVMVGALNVGRIRVVGVEPSTGGLSMPARNVARGEELARFEMGSTVVLLAPAAGPRPIAGLTPGKTLRMGEIIGRLEAGRTVATSPNRVS